MNDDRLIRNNLELSGRSSQFVGPWIHRWYILAFCFVPFLLILFGSRYADDPNFLVLSGQFALAIGAFSALFQLRNKPLLNPIQAVVFLFHWWFAIGPSVAVLFAVLRDDNVMMYQYVSSGGEALWVVALGLPFYAFCANGAIRYGRGRIRPIAFLMPEGALYRPKTLIAYWLVGGMVALITAGLAQKGIVGSQAINYLGGTVSENWLVSALEAIGELAFFATIAVMGYLALPAQHHSYKLKIVAVSLMVFNMGIAFTSGWKGAMIINIVLLFIIFFVWRQKLSLILVSVLALFYLVIVEPFVSQMRFAAEVARITTPEERTELFKLALSRGLSAGDIQMLEMNIESPFRGIYVFADRIASESSLFSGPWNNTISEGLFSLVPRAWYPDKPDVNMGNYFARYLGASHPDDYVNNVGVSIPFEIVGNYGYVAGVITFGIIGVLWGLFCIWLLSEDRLATHPLMPLCVIYALGMEASVGQFLARFRNFPLVLGVAFVLWILLRKRL